VTLDRDLLDAFVPEFEAEASRLAAVRDAAGGPRVLDQLRAMAAALGAPSLSTLVERAAAALEPFDAAALQAAAEALARQARAIGEAGADVGLEATLRPGPSPQPSPAPAESGPAALDAELLAHFLPEFEAACARLGAAGDRAGAARAVAALEGMAASLELGSLRAMLREAPLEPFDASAMPALAEALVRQARRLAEAGRDVGMVAPDPGRAPAPLPEAGGRRRVLVVDDSAMMRRLVREILSLDPDFEVVGEAPDGRAALAAMAALQPELTMLDIEMPELDGIGVLRAWALRGPGEVVIVSSAARPGSATALLVRRLGAAGIVGKPSGALSPDLRQRQGEALLRTARRALGMAA
jgi:CheY-like chemotaxis protein